MKSATYTRRIKNSREIVGVSTVTFGSKNEPTPTEATLAQLKWTQNDVLPQLRALGVKIAIDGFGSEYSSFDYIKEVSDWPRPIEAYRPAC